MKGSRRVFEGIEPRSPILLRGLPYEREPRGIIGLFGSLCSAKKPDGSPHSYRDYFKFMNSSDKSGIIDAQAYGFGEPYRVGEFIIPNFKKLNCLLWSVNVRDVQVGMENIFSALHSDPSLEIYTPFFLKAFEDIDALACDKV